MRTDTTMKYYYASIGMAKTKTVIILNTNEDDEKLITRIAGGNVQPF